MRARPMTDAAKNEWRKGRSSQRTLIAIEHQATEREYARWMAQARTVRGPSWEGTEAVPLAAMGDEEARR